MFVLIPATFASAAAKSYTAFLYGLPAVSPLLASLAALA